ncbi:P-loop NTPase domain-containing protein LPA1 [Cinnamomum micranthum f. kanehirae]|uniref:P-loop NTPase domain-containing protein LPA1 n=1 Tax=Cinnamomum micranthum f. kanehirae TaxID=337451 RepID=A0A3S3MXD4_9MAGN|nr:P-loop NTPase domain-containing protein LPA1 [Cinnamomum micranthum f. kanehirae]
MAARKLCYVVVVDDEDVEKDRAGATSYQPQPNTSFWYTRSVLQSVLQLLGCKAHHTFKISRRVFDILEGENLQMTKDFHAKGASVSAVDMFSNANEQNLEALEKSRIQLFENMKKDLSIESNNRPFNLYKRQTSREEGISYCFALWYQWMWQVNSFFFTVRHMMRSFVDEKENPLLWASTYHAGEFLDPAAVAEAKRKKKDRRVSSTPANPGIEESEASQTDVTTNSSFLGVSPTDKQNTDINVFEQVGSKVLAIEGYKAQSEMVMDSLDRLITAWEVRKESVVVEGVHLSLNFVMGLMKRHPSIIPFLIYIADEEKHLERFAIRAKYMALDPSKNKYVKYIKNIRAIQDFLCKRADKHLVPKVNNTNVDRSVASIHSTVFSCLRKRHTGFSLYDMATNTVKAIHEEYCKQCDTNSISSKGMFRMIQRQGSLRRYMAIVNLDGSVAKAWPFSTVENNGELSASNNGQSEVGSPIYGPLFVHDAEAVNVQFGNFGIGSWPNGAEGTSYTSSANGSRVDTDEEAMRNTSSSSSPLHLNGHAKELIEAVSASESDEEPLKDEDDDSSIATNEFEDELGGSVAESSRSDEEYDEADQMEDGKSGGDDVATRKEDLDLYTNHSGCCHGDGKACKRCRRALSMRHSRKLSQDSMSFRRVHSLPLQRNLSHKNKTCVEPT